MKHPEPSVTPDPCLQCSGPVVFTGWGFVPRYCSSRCRRVASRRRCGQRPRAEVVADPAYRAKLSANARNQWSKPDGRGLGRPRKVSKEGWQNPELFTPDEGEL